jgi:hypothetical protein
MIAASGCCANASPRAGSSSATLAPRCLAPADEPAPGDTLPAPPAGPGELLAAQAARADYGTEGLRHHPYRPKRHVRESLVGARGLIFGLIRLRSSTFICIQINAAMQVTDVSDIRRTITPSPEIGWSAVQPRVWLPPSSERDRGYTAGLVNRHGHALSRRRPPAEVNSDYYATDTVNHAAHKPGTLQGPVYS